MPSRIPDLNPEIKDRLWVLEPNSTRSGYEIQAFLSGEGALGVVDKDDHCDPGVTVISVVVKDEERLERSELPIEYLQPLNDVEQKLGNRCVAFVEDDYP